MENENENEFPEEGVPEEKKDDAGISADLIRGHINTIILRTLSDGDKYGYEIIDSIESKSQGQYTIKQPTLYSALKRLESQGYVTSYWGGSSGGGRRRYFSLTEEGSNFYIRNQQEWEYSRSIIDSLISVNYDTPAPTYPVEQPIEPTIEPSTESTIEPSIEPTEAEEIVAEEEYNAAEPIEEEQPVEEENDALSMLREQTDEEHEEEEKEESDDESDYRDVIGMLYTNAIDSDDPKPNEEKKPIAKAAPEQLSGNIEFFNILEQAEYDGIKVRTSGVYKPKEVVETEAPTAFFNKGKTMFLAALSTFAVIFIEWILLFATRGVTGISMPYALTVLGLGIIFIAVFAIIFVLGYGKNAIKHKNTSYRIVSVVIFAIVSLLIAALAIAKGANLSETSVLLANIVFPILFATNIIVYALIYHAIRAKQ